MLTYGFYNSINGDRKYNADQMSSLFDGIIRDGVFASITDCLIVTALGGMSVAVGKGRAWFNHTWTNNDAAIPLVIDSSELFLNRIDAIVLEINSNNDVRTNSIQILKGTPATSAERPTLTKLNGVYQYPLCYIYIPAGAASIAQSNITNMIGTSDCPFVTGVLETITTDVLLSQWDSEYHAWLAVAQNTFNGDSTQWNNDFDGFLSTSQTTFNNSLSDWGDSFNAWFSSIQDTLSTDAAGSLLNRIDDNATFETAIGNATSIVLENIQLVNGYSKTFIAAYTSSATSKTINGKPWYKPGTTTAPSTVAGKAYTIWYSLSGDCFFIKASAEGTAPAEHVLAGDPFSNEFDTGIIGTMPNIGSITIAPSANDQVIPAGYHNGSGKVSGAAIAYNCAQITNLTGVFASTVKGQVTLNWTNPTDGLFKGVRILCKTTGYPTGPNDGTIVYDNLGSDLVANVAVFTLTEGTAYYFRAFAYSYQSATRLYTTTMDGVLLYGIPYRTQGTEIFTSSGIFTAPPNIPVVDIFCVGGGGGGAVSNGGGGGGGYTATRIYQSVTPGNQYAVTIGAGGAGGQNVAGQQSGSSGGATSFGSLLTANGGGGGLSNEQKGGDGGSGGGGGGAYSTSYNGAGGSDGSDGVYGSYNSNTGLWVYGVGQHSTTRAFAEDGNTLYSGGGAGGTYQYTNGSVASGGAGGGGNGSYYGSTPGSGQTNTGGGGGGYSSGSPAGVGGSGIVIVRWGY